MVDYASWLRVDYINGEAIIAFPRTNMGEEAALVIGRQLSHLAEKPGCNRFVLNLSRVPCLSSTMLGKLIAFHKQVKQRGGRTDSLLPDSGFGRKIRDDAAEQALSHLLDRRTSRGSDSDKCCLTFAILYQWERPVLATGSLAARFDAPLVTRQGR